MCIRKATHNDFSVIRTLTVQLTQRAATALQPKHFRVLYQEANVRLLVNEGTHTVCAFMALRFIPALDSCIRYLVIVHLALDKQALKQGIAAELEAHAANIASLLECNGLLVQADKLPAPAARFYRERGYKMESGTLIKKLA